MTGDVVNRVRVVSQGWPGGPGLNQFYFQLPAGELPSEGLSALECVARVQAAFSAVVDIWPTQWSAQVSNIVDVIDTDNGDLIASHAVAVQTPIVGTRAEGFGPEAAMVCINNLTSGIIDGQRVRGRVFLGPLAPRTDVDGTPDSTMLSRANSFSTILEDNGTTLATYSVWSRRRGVSLRHPTGLGGSAHLITAHSVRNTYAILTSRRQ